MIWEIVMLRGSWIFMITRRIYNVNIKRDETVLH